MSTAWPVIGRAKRISTLDPAASLDGAELVAVVKSSTTLRTTTAAIRRASTGTTAQRPTTLTASDAGWMYFDTTLGKPIWWNGSAWRDATGAAA